MFFEDINNRTIQTGLTLEEAQEHCQDKETSATTASQAALDIELKKSGSVKWFDGYSEE